jgi:hypothetical protein
MSRIMAPLFLVGIGMLLVGLFAASSAWGVALVLVGFMLLTGLAVAAMVKNARTHGVTWDMNPGAARREAAAERKAREREAHRPGRE